MFYTQGQTSELGSDVTVYTRNHIDRANAFFAGTTGKGGRIVHLINGSRFVCGRRFSQSPYILEDHSHTVDSFSSKVDGVKVCTRCFNCMKKSTVKANDIKVDLIKLSQMHFMIISEAISNAATLANGNHSRQVEGMAITNPNIYEHAKQISDTVTLNAFKFKGKHGAQSFPIDTRYVTMWEEMPSNLLKLFTVSQAMMRHGQISIIKPAELGEPHLMLIANSSIVYYMACRICKLEDTKHQTEVYSVTPLPYEEIDYNKY